MPPRLPKGKRRAPLEEALRTKLAALYPRARLAYEAGRRAKRLVAAVEEERRLSRPGNYMQLVEADGEPRVEIDGRWYQQREVGALPPSLVEWDSQRWYPSVVERYAYGMNFDGWAHVDPWIEVWVSICRDLHGLSRTKAVAIAAAVDPKVDPKERTRTRRAPKRRRAEMEESIAFEIRLAEGVERSYEEISRHRSVKVRRRTLRDAIAFVRTIDQHCRKMVDERSRWIASVPQRPEDVRDLWRDLIKARERWIIAAARNHDLTNLLQARRKR